MEPALTHAGQLVEVSKRFARRLLSIGENRCELLMVEVQEERERFLHAILLALGMAGFGLLARMTHGARDLADRAKTMAVWASSSALLVAGLKALRRGPPPAGTAKSSWFQTILNTVRMASTIWFAFRACGEKEEQK
jgi:uncharacterized membrane protein YqjE